MVEVQCLVGILLLPLTLAFTVYLESSHCFSHDTEQSPFNCSMSCYNHINFPLIWGKLKLLCASFTRLLCILGEEDMP